METGFEFYGKDSLKLYCLKEAVQDGTVSFRLFLESDGTERDIRDVRIPGQPRYRFNNFNITEDPSDNSITFCPNVIGCYVYIAINSPLPIKAEIIKKGETVPAERFELDEGEIKIGFCPQGLKMYIVYIETDEPLTEEQQSELTELNNENSRLEAEINGFLAKKEELERKNRELTAQRDRLAGDIEMLRAECEKDYSRAQTDAGELKARYEIDKNVLAYYSEKGVTPIEELLAKAEEDIKKIEDQIKVFVEAAEKRAAEIENG